MLVMSANNDSPLPSMTKDLVLKLAPAIHEHYRAQAKSEGWQLSHDAPYEELPPEARAANLAAAERIPSVLAAAGISIRANAVSPEAADVSKYLESNIEAAAVAEHEGWMQEKLNAGWTYGNEPDDERKLEPLLVPYEDLSEEEKKKVRSAVRNYPEILHRAGMSMHVSA